MKIKKFNENSEYIPEVYDLELKVMLDGVDGEMWDIDNVDFKISY